MKIRIENIALLKRLKTSFVEIAIFLYLFVTLKLVSEFDNNLIFRGMMVNIDTRNQNFFIEEDEVKKIISSKMGNSDSVLLADIDILKIENAIKQHPSVEDADVYCRVDGKLCANVVQRRPIARIFNKRSSFYMDDKGKLMPLSNKHSSRVLCVSGNVKFDLSDNNIRPIDSLSVDEKIRRNQLCDVYKLIATINANDFFKALIEQIEICNNGDLILVPKVGPRKIEFGSIENYETKMRKIELFYKKGFHSQNWTKYNKLNVKFKNQVICTKI